MTPRQEAARAPRSDSEASRSRLLAAGLQLFAQQGFARTSTRELAESAQVNISAISYYFGDKAGLYRAVFFEPLAEVGDGVARLADPALTLADALRVFYEGFLEPLRHGDEARLCMKLHFREMLEPTGLWEEGIAQSIRPLHDGLVALLCRHLGLGRADDDLLRLAVCLEGLGVHMHLGRDVVDQLAPQLHTVPDALDTWADRLVLFALSMFEAEKRRRLETPQKTQKTRKRGSAR